MESPGICLEKELKKSGMSQKELAQRTGVSEKHISSVINGDSTISPTFARKLGYVFRDSSYWLNIQATYEDEQLRLKEEKSISAEEMAILKPLHDITSYFISQGYMHNNCGDVSKVIQLRELLNVSDLLLIPKVTYNAAYRAQLSTNIKVDPYVLFAWQRLCEKETESIVIHEELNKKLLNDYLPKIKHLMFENISSVVGKLQELFAECGIAFQVVKNFRGAPVQGFIKESANNRLILCLTIRGRRADRFWFTLFHEIAHIMNGDYAVRFVDFDSVQSEMETKADLFAKNYLIDQDIYETFVRSNQTISWSDIETLADKTGVEPFIVLGRLQRDDVLEWSDYSDKVVYYEWTA